MDWMTFVGGVVVGVLVWHFVWPWLKKMVG